MSTSQLLKMRVFSLHPTLTCTKLIKLNTFKCKFYVYSLPAVSSRSLSSSSMYYSNVLIWQLGLQPCRLMQTKFLSPLLSAHRSSSMVRENKTESITRPRPNLMSNPFKKERLADQTLIREIFATKCDANWDIEDWTNLVESLPLASQNKWDTICMHTLYIDKNISIGRKLMTYLETRADAPSNIIITFYIGLLGETSNGSDHQDDETYKYYQLLLTRTDILDAGSIEVLISGLSMTKYYLECFKLLKICQETSVPSASTLVKLLRGGLRNKDMKTCQLSLSSIEELIDPSTFIQYLPTLVNECLSVNNEEGLQFVMNFMQKHHLLVPQNLLDEVIYIFNRYQPDQWIAKYSFIHHKSGKCQVCRHQMQKSEVSDDDFKAIQSAFLEQVIVGKNIFFKSTPEEVDSFITFLKKNGPFDVVIDGLNILHRNNAHKVKKDQLESVVEYYTSHGMRILLLGSRMLNQHIVNIKNMKPKPAIYMTSTSKADDVFFLYAALHSGKNTVVVSYDKLRDHKFLLKPSLRHIFQRWITAAQVFDWFILKSGEFVVGKRHLHLLGPSHDEAGWHIPVNDMSYSNPFGKFGVLCLRNREKFIVPLTPEVRHNTPSAKKHTKNFSASLFSSQIEPDENYSRTAEDYTRPAIDSTRPTRNYNKTAGDYIRHAGESTRPARNYNNATGDYTKPAENTTRSVNNLSASNSNNSSSTQMPKRQKFNPSKQTKFTGDKDWFDN